MVESCVNEEVSTVGVEAVHPASVTIDSVTRAMLVSIFEGEVIGEYLTRGVYNSMIDLCTENLVIKSMQEEVDLEIMMSSFIKSAVKTIVDDSSTEISSELEVA